jgi:hypothetical protein
MWIRNLFDPGSEMEKSGSGIRDNHPGSATLYRTTHNRRCFVPKTVQIQECADPKLLSRSGNVLYLSYIKNCED